MSTSPSSPDLTPIPIQPAIAMLFCFAVGIGFDRVVGVDWQISIAIVVVSLFVWWLAQSRKLTSYGLLALAVTLVGSGAFYHHGRWNWFSANDLAVYCDNNPRPVCLRGTIVSEGRYVAKPIESLFDALPRGESTRFRVRATAVRDGTQWLPADGMANLTIRERVSHVQFGDEVELVGQLFRIGKPSSPGQFDFQNFMRAQKQSCAIHCNFADALVVQQQAPQRSNVFLLSRLRSELDQLIHRHVGSEQAGFASAILLGNREQLPFEHRELFLKTGTAHLLAISGLHVGILASVFLLMYQFGILGRRWALLLTIAFVFFYAWLVEFRPPVSRAAILLTLFCTGRLIGRKGNDYSLLAIAGFIILLINPDDLFQLGPQLSFLAFATIILFKDCIFPRFSEDPIDRLIRNTRPVEVRLMQQFGRKLRQAILVSGLIWVVGLPLVAKNFHLVTPIALLVNPVVLFPIALSLFAGLGVCVFGSWLPVVGDLCGVVCGASLQSVSWCITKAEEVSFGHWWTVGPSQLAIGGFYLLLVGFAIISFANGNKALMRKFVLLWSGWILFAWLLPTHCVKMYERKRMDSLQATFLDVGHGSSVLLQLPGGQAMLYDAGSIASSKFAAETVSNLLWKQGVGHLDSIVVSHADIDHLNAIPDIVERFSVGKVYVSLPMLRSRAGSEVVQEFFSRLDSHGVRFGEIGCGDIACLANETRLEVLLPPDSGTASSTNSDSVVLLIDVEGKKILLPGDLEQNGLRLLLAREPIDCDLAMLPHHGSKNSQPKAFVDWCNPEILIVSAGGKKLDEDVLRQVATPERNVLTTARQGTIRVEVDSGKPDRISHWAGDGWVTLLRK